MVTKSRRVSNAWTLAALAAALLVTGCGGGSGGPGGSESSGAPVNFLPHALLTAGDVQTIISQAVTQAAHDRVNVVVAVSDPEGVILGVLEMTAGLGATRSPFPDTVNAVAPFSNTKASIAIEKARTAAFLSSNQNAFSTTTGLFIVQDHYPPGVANEPQGPLFMLTLSQLPCSDVRKGVENGVTGAPGGIPLYKNGQFAGGIGIDGTGGEEDEVIALAGAGGIYFPPSAITADKIFLGGIQLAWINTQPPPPLSAIPFAALPGQIDSSCVVDSAGTACPSSPTDAAPSPFPAAVFAGVQGELRFPIIDGAPAPAPGGGSVNLTAADVTTIITQSVALAKRTRAAIRQPVGVPARMHVGITDIAGNVIGEFAMNDATGFSYEIVIQKGRTVTAFSDPSQPLGRRIRAILGVGGPLAFTSRTIEFLGEPFYPPGINADPPGPLNGIQTELYNSPPAPNCSPYPAGQSNGICLFPGSEPLYKDGVLVGGLGLSGDGVDQDDFITDGGAQGFHAPGNITADHIEFRGTPLPYVKFPRHPLL